MDLLKDQNFAGGATTLESLRYAVFALGNSTYEHYCAAGRQADGYLAARGAKRIGERGEGDHNKNLDEDYLSWKDGMFQVLKEELGLQEVDVGDQADFVVKELDAASQDMSTVYLGELHNRTTSNSAPVYDAKHPYPAALVSSRELFLDGERNCVFAEFDITGAGIRYKAGDHIGIWPMNPEQEVQRTLNVLGLQGSTIIDVISLDPALAKVPFPTPTTIESSLRHYLDINAPVSRQTCSALSCWAPKGSDAERQLLRWGSDKEIFLEEVAKRGLTLSRLLMQANGEDPTADPATIPDQVWRIPFDRLISFVPRLQPRYYSISSSPKLYPNSVHVTAVVLKYQAGLRGGDVTPENAKFIYGTASNYLLNLRVEQGLQQPRSQLRALPDLSTHVLAPKYKIGGPRDAYLSQGVLRVPIHVRSSNFRLPANVRLPVVMVGPGTGVAPFRGFLQERVALAREAKKIHGPDALKDWGEMILFYGCRSPSSDYLYSEEWLAYAQELNGKFKMFTAFSRVKGKAKVYVQHLISEERRRVEDAIIGGKGCIYICGDAGHMAKDVEDVLRDVLAGAKPSEGEREFQLLKSEGRLHLDVW